MIAIVGPTCITIIHHYYRMFILDLRTSADVRPPCWSRFEAGMNHEPMSHHALTLKVSGQVLVLCCQVLLAGEGVLLILRVGGGGFPGDRVHHIPRHVLVSFSYQQLPISLTAHLEENQWDIPWESDPRVLLEINQSR